MCYLITATPCDRGIALTEKLSNLANGIHLTGARGVFQTKQFETRVFMIFRATHHYSEWCQDGVRARDMGVSEPCPNHFCPTLSVPSEK